MPADDPIAYFNGWLREPIKVVGGFSVRAVMDALNAHPLARDEGAASYLANLRVYDVVPGQFRVCGENQDVWHFFVRSGTESQGDPPVYLQSSLDLHIDHGIPKRTILNDDCVMVCSRFSQFLFHMLGERICVRTEGCSAYRAGVNGIVFEEAVELDSSFANPLGDFAGIRGCYHSAEALCLPEWGAAFINAESRQRFVDRYAPTVGQKWG